VTKLSRNFRPLKKVKVSTTGQVEACQLLPPTELTTGQVEACQLSPTELTTGQVEACQLLSPTELTTGQVEACQLPSALMILSSEIITKAEAYKGVKYRRDLLTLGSGNCFYYAVSDNNNLNPENKKIDHLSLRAQVCNLVESLYQNPDGSRLSNFIKDFDMLHNKKDDGPFDKWIRKQRKNGMFVNELFIHATSTYLKQDIEVVGIKVLIVNEKDIIKEVVIVSNYTIESLAMPKKESITLGHQSQHFQLLVRSEQTTGQVEACQLLPPTELTTAAKFKCDKCPFNTIEGTNLMNTTKAMMASRILFATNVIIQLTIEHQLSYTLRSVFQ
jgi:hypothetical protein